MQRGEDVDTIGVMAVSRKKLALIHIVKKEIGLTDEAYRKLLREVTGVESASLLDDEGFRKLMNYLVRSPYYRLNRFGLTLKQKLFLQYLGRQLGWDQGHLSNFLRKYYHKAEINELTKREASRAIESLKGVMQHSGTKDHTAGEGRRGS